MTDKQNDDHQAKCKKERHDMIQKSIKRNRERLAMCEFFDTKYGGGNWAYAKGYKKHESRHIINDKDLREFHDKYQV